MSYKQEVLMEVYHDIFKATKIIGNIDHNFAYINQASSYVTIIRSCEQILLSVAEELYQMVVEEDNKAKEE